MHLILFVIAVILFVAGVLRLIERDWVPGVLLIILACLVGPGGVSLFT